MTERGSHHYRRPPDVEEALSSMLWTPYERTQTESSSEDDDERLNRKLCKSHSSYDYRHLSPRTLMPLSSPYFGNDDSLLTTSASTAAGGAILRPTPFVPFSNFFYNNYATRDNNPARTPNYHKNYDSPANHFRFSYPYCGPMPNLNKWWSTALSVNEPPPYDVLYAQTNTYNNPSMEAPTFDAFRTIRSTVCSDFKHQLPNSDKSTDGEVNAFEDAFISKVESTSSFISCINSPKLITQHVAPNIDSRLYITQSNCNNNNITTTRMHQPNDDVRQCYSPNNASAERRPQSVQATNEGSQQSKEANNNSSFRSAASSQSNTKADVAGNGNYEYMNKTREGETRSSKATATTTTQVNQPVSSINPCSTSPVNARSDVNTEYAAATAANRLDRRMNTTATLTPAMNAIANLLTLVCDKAADTTGERDNNSHSHKATAEHNASAVVVHSSKCGESTIIQSTTSSISSHRTERATLEAAVLPLAAPSPPPPSSSSTRSPSRSPSHLWRKSRLKQSRTRFESSLAASVAIAPVSLFVDSNANSIGALTPNKCLAELERLYAEFRASESALAVARVSNCGCTSSDANDSMSNMRVDIPATASDSNTAIVSSLQQTTNHMLTTSSVFLTSTNSITTNCSASAVSAANGHNDNTTIDNLNNNIDNRASNDGKKHAIAGGKGDSNSNLVAILATDSRQCQPSLTIKVNDDDNNNNNNNHNNNNNREASISFLKLQSCLNVVLHQPVSNKNGVSVVNCNYLGNKVIDANDNESRTNKYIIGNVGGASGNAPVVATPSATSNASVNSSSSCPVPKVSGRGRGSGSGDDVAKNILNNNSESDVAAAAAVVVDSGVHIISVSDRAKSACAIRSPASSCAADSQSTGRSRTFTSTECQTDEIPSVHLRANRVSSPTATNREQRRRERREWRHQQLHNQPSSNSLQLQLSHRRPIVERHSMPAPPPVTLLHPQHMHHPVAQAATLPAALSAMLRPMLPNLLHSHFPPPYSALPLSGGSGAGGGHLPPLPPLGCRPLPPLPGTTLVTSVISTVPMPGAPVASDGRFTLPLPIIRRSPSERSGKGCCGQWFAGPPLRALIAVVALGGVACALGGAALGATGLAGPPNSHLTAALLMIGVGVVLVTVSGAAWRMTAPGGPPCLSLGSNADLGRCGRRPCGRGNGTPHGPLYPEFQHRPPPPSYQASMQEYRLRLLLLDRDRQNGAVRGNSPPPTYRSHLGSLLRAPLSTTIRGGSSSSIGGTSECSLPPSYRSRNTTPVTVCRERSIETAPSGRLLPNEDIAEPVSIEQLPGYSSLQPRPPSALRPASLSAKTTPTADLTKIVTNQKSDTQLRPAAIVEAETSSIVGLGEGEAESNLHSAKEKLHPRVFDSHSSSVDRRNLNLVTVVTITKAHAQKNSEPCGTISREPIEALAHL